PQEEEDSLSFPETTSGTEEGLQTAEAWTQARKQFRAELESLGNIEKWLAHKPSRSNQEQRYWQRIKARRAERMAAVKSAVTDSLDRSPPKSSPPRKKGGVPLVCAPYPQALVTLHNLLHKQRLQMVDVFKAAGMEGKKMTRAEFIRVIQETRVPISNEDLEDVVVFLTSLTPGNYISPNDLMECQKQWLEMRKREFQETKPATCKTAPCPPSAGDTARQMKPRAPTKPERKLIRLEVPPLDTQPERRHLSCDEMEEIGKVSRERRRQKKNKDSPIEWKEKCRMVRSGDGPVDEHCLPSTLEADLGELVNRYRRNAVVSYLKSSELCKELNVPIADPTLQEGLLHPGDKIIKEGGDIRKLRQPGGYYSTGRADALSSGSTSRPGTASGSQAKEAENRLTFALTKRSSETAQNFISVKHAILSYFFFSYSLPPPFFNSHLQRSKTQKSSDNKFWPGHLLDKLCLYFPDKQHDRAHALFSYV
ncbi:EF-hand calcium-binding domain-containing protein 12, partial [Nipponia nippon]